MGSRRSLLPPTRFFVAASLLVAALAAQQAAPPGAPLVRDVRGTVREAGEGEVRVTLWHNDVDRASAALVAEAVAAADGSFAFASVPWFEKQQWHHHSFVVIARTEHRVGALSVNHDGVNPGRLAIVLGAAVDLRGVLRGQDGGLPIAGAQVWASTLGKPNKTAYVLLGSPVPPWTAVTDAEGRFTLKGLPALPLYLTASGAEHATTLIDVADPAQHVEMALARGGKVSGVVLLPDGKPAARVRVLTYGEGGWPAQTLSGDDGTFCLAGLSASTYKVWAEAPDLTVIAVLGLRVEGGAAIVNQKVQLVRGGFIVGRIVDDGTGAPVWPGLLAHVAMHGPARGPDGPYCEVTPVLRDGTFRIRAPAGRNHIQLRGVDGGSRPSAYVEVVEGQETKVELRLPKARWWRHA